ncbi:hypothetical protein [Pseudaminobacter soli (ex Li et al. 2025)]|uniref:Uncharacterized protein n=1 Tax=Pseudaminobacter soli (ex Li et al. 2025) TaxID=1295366 RepID=A0A2P7SG98_9HYPH|nr:hypothetical protein [Mesorhizobium soli]PSJ61526.1 hypothetical protein C7I85_10790 [Mesorhizobium soli]
MSLALTSIASGGGMRDKIDQVINLDIDLDGDDERNSPSSKGPWHPQDLGSADGIILVFPDGPDVMVRRLARAFEETFTFDDRRKLCGFDLLSFPMGLGGHNLRIDDHACIDLVPDSPDYRFTISTHNGEQALLVTTDARLMADFVRQYLLARVEYCPELEVLL